MFSVGKKMSFMFRTRDDQGTLMIIGNRTGDFAEISLRNGSLEFSANLGPGKCTVFSL